jgi:hypothetical protein
MAEFTLWQRWKAMIKDLFMNGFEQLNQHCSVFLQTQDGATTSSSALSHLLAGFPLSRDQCKERIIGHDEVPELPEDEIAEHSQVLQDFLSQPMDRLLVSESVINKIQSMSADRQVAENTMIGLANSCRNIHETILKEAFTEGYFYHALESMKKEREAAIPLFVPH